MLQRTDPRLTYLDSGRHRDVYRYKNCVIKFPIGNEGIHANNKEYKIFLYFTRNKKVENTGDYARCRLLDGVLYFTKNKNVENIDGNYARCRLLDGDILIMEYLPKINLPWKDLPSWAGCIDCCQVGFSKTGVLKAYDYGD